MPRRRLRAPARQQTDADFTTALAAICKGNFLVVTCINLLLMKFFEVPRLPLHYLPIGAVALWLLGQLAVLGPARRAANVPPAIATRSA